jgi:hypothetical protein
MTAGLKFSLEGFTKMVKYHIGNSNPIPDIGIMIPPDKVAGRAVFILEMIRNSLMIQYNTILDQ